MQTSVLISGLVLLIPFLYASASIPDACAAIRDTNYDSGSCTGDKTSKAGKTCCSREKVPGQLLGKTICQTCWIESDSKGSYERCTSPTEQAFKLPETNRANPLQGGGVLEQPIGPNSNQSFGLKAGSVLQGQNLTFAQANFSSNDSSNDNLAMKKSDLVSDEIQNTTTAEGDKEKQDESNTTEEPDEDNAEDAEN